MSVTMVLAVASGPARPATAEDLASVRVGVVVDAPKLGPTLVVRLEKAARARFGRAFTLIGSDTMSDALQDARDEINQKCRAGVLDQRCQIDLGRGVGATHIGSVGVSKGAARCEVSVELLNISKGAAEGTGSGKASCADTDKLVDAVEVAVDAAVDAARGKVATGGGRIEGAEQSGPDLDRFVREADEAKARAEAAWRDLQAGLSRSTAGQQVSLLEAYLKAVGEDGPHAEEARAERLRLREGLAREALAKVRVVLASKPLPLDRKKAALAEWMEAYRDTAAAREAEASAAELEGEARGDMVSVPAGEFFMGCDERVDRECGADEKPGRKVQVTAFRIDRTEVTVAAYRRCVAAGACPSSGVDTQFWDGKDQGAGACNWARGDRETHPMNCVDWSMADRFCRWAGKRLPSEAEWEKAARGTDGRKYSWGNEGYGARKVANIADARAKREYPSWTTAEGYDDGFVETAPVGSFPDGRSPYGADDLIGNVWEWSSGGYEAGKYRSLRGGAWNYGPSVARASFRYKVAPARRNASVGFRCAQ